MHSAWKLPMNKKIKLQVTDCNFEINTFSLLLWYKFLTVQSFKPQHMRSINFHWHLTSRIKDLFISCLRRAINFWELNAYLRKFISRWHQRNRINQDYKIFFTKIEKFDRPERFRLPQVRRKVWFSKFYPFNFLERNEKLKFLEGIW